MASSPCVSPEAGLLEAQPSGTTPNPAHKRAATPPAPSPFLKVSRQCACGPRCTSAPPGRWASTSSWCTRSSTTPSTRPWADTPRASTSPFMSGNSITVPWSTTAVFRRRHGHQRREDARRRVVLTVLREAASSTLPTTKSRAVCTAWALAASTPSRRNWMSKSARRLCPAGTGLRQGQAHQQAA